VGNPKEFGAERCKGAPWCCSPAWGVGWLGSWQAGGHICPAGYSSATLQCSSHTSPAHERHVLLESTVGLHTRDQDCFLVGSSHQDCFLVGSSHQDCFPVASPPNTLLGPRLLPSGLQLESKRQMPQVGSMVACCFRSSESESTNTAFLCVRCGELA
jgi:hypothetical protein